MHGGWWPDAIRHADLYGRRGVADSDPLRMGTPCARIQWHYFFCIRIAYRPTQSRSCGCLPDKCPFPSPDSRHALSLGLNAMADSRHDISSYFSNVCHGSRACSQGVRVGRRSSSLKR
jgi:hypothetical protein